MRGGGVQAKANFIPRHYSLTMDPEAMFLLIQALQVAHRELDVDPQLKEILDELEAAFVGELPQPPSDPISEDHVPEEEQQT